MMQMVMIMMIMMMMPVIDAIDDFVTLDFEMMFLTKMTIITMMIMRMILSLYLSLDFFALSVYLLIRPVNDNESIMSVDTNDVD